MSANESPAVIPDDKMDDSASGSPGRISVSSAKAFHNLMGDLSQELRDKIFGLALKVDDTSKEFPNLLIAFSLRRHAKEYQHLTSLYYKNNAVRINRFDRERFCHILKKTKENAHRFIRHVDLVRHLDIVLSENYDEDDWLKMRETTEFFTNRSSPLFEIAKLKTLHIKVNLRHPHFDPMIANLIPKSLGTLASVVLRLDNDYEEEDGGLGVSLAPDKEFAPHEAMMVKAVSGDLGEGWKVELTGKIGQDATEEDEHGNGDDEDDEEHWEREYTWRKKFGEEKDERTVEGN